MLSSFHIIVYIHLTTKLDEAIIKAAKDGKDIVLTVNPGDGKTHIVRMLKSKLEYLSTPAVVELDASTLSNDQIYQAWLAARKKNAPFVIAINAAVLYSVYNAFPDFEPIKEAYTQMLHAVVFHEEAHESKDLVVFDLSKREALTGEILKQAISKMTAEDHYKECKKCPLYDSCVVNKNRKMLNNALFQERLGIILQRVSLQGYHATLRELQSFIVYLIFGNRSCKQLMKNYYETDDHQLLFSVRDPQYLDMVTFINSLYRDGLLDREWAITKADAFSEKLASGRVFAANGGTPSDVNGLFIQDEGEDTDKQFYMFKVVADGVDPDKTTFSPRSSLGWDAIGITKANKYPEETIKLFDFLASEEGQYLLMWGVEGKDWTIENGVHVPNEKTIPGFRADWGAYSKETGIRKWSWFIKNGYGSDGTPYDLVTKYDLDAVAAHAMVSMAGSVWDTAPYDNVSPTSGTPEALAEQKCNDIIDQYFAQMVYAQSEDEVKTLYEDMMSELEANDAAAVEKIYTENYQEHLKLWS